MTLMGAAPQCAGLRDIIHAHTADLGGADLLSEGQKAILRRAALLQLQAEMLEQKFAQREDGSATGNEIEVYQRTSNTMPWAARRPQSASHKRD